MRNGSLVALVLLLSFPAVAQTPPPPATSPGTSIEALVKQLGAEDYARRTLATEELRKRGETARKALEEVANSGTVEQKARARSLLAELDAARAPRSRQVEAPAGGDAARRRLEEHTRRWRSAGSGSPAVISFGMSSGGNGARSVQTRGNDTLSVDRQADGTMVIEVKVRDPNTGEVESERYEVKDVEELKQKHRAVYDRYAMWGMFEKNAANPFQINMRTLGGPRRPPRRLTPPVRVPPVPQESVFGLRLVEVPAALRAHVPGITPRAMLVDAVEPDSAGAAMGVRRHDIVLMVDNALPVADATSFRAAIAASDDDTVRIGLIRKGEAREIQGPRPK